MLEARRDLPGWAKERVLRVLLDPEHGTLAGNTLYKIAKIASVSYSWTHDTWKDLLDEGAFTPSTARKGTDPRDATLTDIQAAYTYWLHHRPPRVYSDHHVLGAVEFLKSIEQRQDLQYLATTYLAENLVQGHLFPRRFDLYIRQSQAAAWTKELNRRGFPIDSKDSGKGTIRLLSADPSTMDEEVTVQDTPLPPDRPVRGFWIARAPLLIVDLLEEGGPCTEAARMLMEKTYATPLRRA